MIIQFLLHSLFIGERDRQIRVERAAKAIQQEGLTPKQAAEEQGLKFDDLNREQIQASRERQFLRTPKSFDSGASIRAKQAKEQQQKTASQPKDNFQIKEIKPGVFRITEGGGIASGGSVRIIEGKQALQDAGIRQINKNAFETTTFSRRRAGLEPTPERKPSLSPLTQGQSPLNTQTPLTTQRTSVPIGLGGKGGSVIQQTQLSGIQPTPFETQLSSKFEKVGDNNNLLRTASPFLQRSTPQPTTPSFDKREAAQSIFSRVQADRERRGLTNLGKDTAIESALRSSVFPEGSSQNPLIDRLPKQTTSPLDFSSRKNFEVRIGVVKRAEEDLAKRQQSTVDKIRFIPGIDDDTTFKFRFKEVGSVPIVVPSFGIGLPKKKDFKILIPSQKGETTFQVQPQETARTLLAAPKTFTFDFGKQLVISASKAGLAVEGQARGVSQNFKKGIINPLKTRTVEESFIAGKKTPGAVKETFNPQTPEGLVGITFAALGARSLGKQAVVKQVTKVPKSSSTGFVQFGKSEPKLNIDFTQFNLERVSRTKGSKPDLIGKGIEKVPDISKTDIIKPSTQVVESVGPKNFRQITINEPGSPSFSLIEKDFLGSRFTTEVTTQPSGKFKAVVKKDGKPFSKFKGKQKKSSSQDIEIIGGQSGFSQFQTGTSDVLTGKQVLQFRGVGDPKKVGFKTSGEIFRTQTLAGRTTGPRVRRGAEAFIDLNEGKRGFKPSFQEFETVNFKFGKRGAGDQRRASTFKVEPGKLSLTQEPRFEVISKGDQLAKGKIFFLEETPISQNILNVGKKGSKRGFEVAKSLARSKKAQSSFSRSSKGLNTILDSGRKSSKRGKGGSKGRRVNPNELVVDPQRFSPKFERFSIKDPRVRVRVKPVVIPAFRSSILSGRSQFKSSVFDGVKPLEDEDVIVTPRDVQSFEPIVDVINDPVPVIDRPPPPIITRFGGGDPPPPDPIGGNPPPPVFVPPFGLGGFLQPGGRGRGGKSGDRSFRRTPSVTAIALDIKEQVRKGRKSKDDEVFSGFEIRGVRKGKVKKTGLEAVLGGF